jgi:hypothetical protein
MAVKKDPRHTNNAILFVLAAILLGGAVFAGMMFGQSASEPVHAEDVPSTEVRDDDARQADNAILPDMASPQSTETTAPFYPSDQEKVALLAGSAFSDQVSSGMGYCGG